MGFKASHNIIIAWKVVKHVPCSTVQEVKVS